MPHAIIEMPSVLADDSGGQHTMNNHTTTNSTARPPFDLPSHIRQSHEKINGSTPRTSSHTSIKNGVVVDGDYSDAVGGRMSADQQQYDSTLTSIPNARTSAGSWENRPRRSESQLSQLSAHREVNGVIDGGRKSPAPSQLPNGISRLSNGDRGSFTSANGVLTNGQTSSDYSKLNGSPVEPFNKTDIPPPISTNPGSTGPLTYNSSLTPASPVVNAAETPPRSHTVSPHRFSSPPAFVNPLTQAPTASSSSLQPAQTPQLKHRHTLQVPKPGTGRNSRDGEDGVYSTGRFSPTAVASGGFRRGSLSLNRRNTQSIHSNMPHDEIQPDEDAARWAEAVRQKRASKRKRKDDEEDDRVVVGTKVDQNHVNWITAYNMLTGIRFTVSRTNAKMDRPLTDADFDARHKFSFDM
jgi:1-phosphatidylinositol-4-phosphate 5-kinase